MISSCKLKVAVGPVFKRMLFEERREPREQGRDLRGKTYIVVCSLFGVCPRLL